MRLKNKKSKLLPILLVVIGVILVALGTYAYAYTNHLGPFRDSSSPTPKKSTDSVRDTNSVDYSGPSDDDIASSQDAKKRSSDPQSSGPSVQSNGSSGDRKSANVGISYAGINGSSLEIRIFVNNIIEGSGTCTAIVSMGSVSVTETTNAFVDTSSSICEPIYIPKNKLSSGRWLIKASYSSPTSVGSSEESVTIP